MGVLAAQKAKVNVIKQRPLGAGNDACKVICKKFIDYALCTSTLLAKTLWLLREDLKKIGTPLKNEIG